MSETATSQGGGLEAKMMKLAEWSGKLMEIKILAAIKSTFSVIVPIYILGGLAIMINYVILPWILQGDALATAQMWGNFVNNGTLNTMAVTVCGILGYMLAREKQFDNPVACTIISLAAFFTIMPLAVEVTDAVNGDLVYTVSSAFITGNLGSGGLFGAMIAAGVATSLYIKLSSIDKLKINMGEGVPPMVSQTFSGLIPMMIVLSLFGAAAMACQALFGMDAMSIIRMFISTPLQKLGSSLPAVLLIYSLGNLLWIVGVHNSTIQATILDPIMMVAITENMNAFAAGDPIPNILTYSFYVFCQMGGSGCCLPLIVDTFLFSKDKAKRTIATIGGASSIFNICEPELFGYPIVFNLTLGIPFIVAPAVSLVLYYFAVATGLIGPAVAMVPWTTPPFISGFLASAGDWRNVVFQVFLFVLDMAIWLPFLKADDRMVAQRALEESAET